MATWHQMQARKRPGFTLQNPTMWSVVDDPPNQPCGIMLFPSEQAAKDFMSATEGDHRFILPPSKQEKTDGAGTEILDGQPAQTVRSKGRRNTRHA